jgi:hypothetical protein
MARSRSLGVSNIACKQPCKHRTETVAIAAGDSLREGADKEPTAVAERSLQRFEQMLKQETFELRAYDCGSAFIHD